LSPMPRAKAQPNATCGINLTDTHLDRRRFTIRCQAHYRPPFAGLRVIGHRWSAASHALKDFLGRNGVPYQWFDVESSDEEVRTLLRKAGLDDSRLPVVLFDDGSRLVEPSMQEVAAKMGGRTRAERPFYDLVIVGGGPAEKDDGDDAPAHAALPVVGPSLWS
jgi:hypothetical protein